MSIIDTDVQNHPPRRRQIKRILQNAPPTKAKPRRTKITDQLPCRLKSSSTNPPPSKTKPLRTKPTVRRSWRQKSPSTKTPCRLTSPANQSKTPPNNRRGFFFAFRALSLFALFLQTPSLSALVLQAPSHFTSGSFLWSSRMLTKRRMSSSPGKESPIQLMCEPCSSGILYQMPGFLPVPS